VDVDIQVAPLSDPGRVEIDVRRALYGYLNPLRGDAGGQGENSGWPFGRPVTEGELHGVVQGVDGVELVTGLQIWETNPRTSERAGVPAQGRLELKPEELVFSVNHAVHAAKADRR
jgi:hypothetical protein